MASLNLHALSSSPVSATFGQGASFKLEQPVGSMSISPSSRDVVLASKEGLHIIDLDSPYSPPRHLPHRTQWEVADVQWSPFAIRDSWVVSTSNQKALVWNVSGHAWRDPIEFVLHGHTRAITDINFSAHHPDVLATCAVDSFVHCWDLRAPLRPAFSFSDWFAGATQVKWSRRDEHVVASSHDRFLHIWDDRKGAYPARTIEAHSTKIYGIDWDRFEPSKIVTCSLDKTIKFWDTRFEEDTPRRVIETPFPVWRARHTPFGWGLTVMPQRDNGDVHLYDRRPVDDRDHNRYVRPVHIFEGHKGQVKEFLWRHHGATSDGIDHRDFQLVSWGTDRELKLHHVSSETLADVGYEKGVSKTQRFNLTRRGARYRTFRDGIYEPQSPSELPSRSDVLSSQSHLLSARQRQSTNVGMSKVPVSQFRGWLQAGRREKRTGMHAKNQSKQETDPIAWMRNVKISSWDPDMLADEMTQVGDKFKRVDFESVEFSQRKAVMSLQGPWGNLGSAVYLRVEFRFPKAYPRGAKAIIHVQRRNNVDSETHRKLVRETQQLAETFAANDRGCIEAVVRYLLKEQTLEQIISWTQTDSMTGSKLLTATGLPDDSSSDSDDDRLENSANPAHSSTNARVPLAQTSGAIWAENGNLVCFFLPRSQGPTSYLTTIGMDAMDESDGNRVFEGFGKFPAESAARRSKKNTKADSDDSDSDGESAASDSSDSSSSSSSPSEEVVNVRDKYASYRGTILSLHRSRSLDGSNKSTTMEGTKVGDSEKKNYPSIRHDMHDLLPSKQILAQQYRILGDRAEVCEYNAGIAEAAGHEDLSAVWKLASLIVKNEVPLTLRRLTKSNSESIILVARQAVHSLKRKDSGIGLGEGKAYEPDRSALYGQLRWGRSPLASGYLIPAMFDYFERIADTQMLAMLSCVFAEPETQIELTPDMDRSHRSPHKLVTSKYFASQEVADAAASDKSVVRKGRSGTNQNVRLSLPGSRHSPSEHDLGRTRSISKPASIVGPTVSIMPGVSLGLSAPRVIAQDPSGWISALHSAEASLATSPEDRRHIRYSDTNLALSKPRTNTLSRTYSNSNSPPSQNGSTGTSSLKKTSPSTSFIPTGWASGGILGSRGPRPSFGGAEAEHEDSKRANSKSVAASRKSSRPQTESLKTRGNSRGSSKTITKLDNSSSRVKQPSSKQPAIRTTVHNQDKFDLDNRAHVPLLDPALQDKFRAYRTQYAHLLEVWQLWVQRAEMLQPHGPNTNSPGTYVRRRRRNDWHERAVPHQGLQIRRCCVRCGHALEPIEVNGVAVKWHCVKPSCSSLARQLPTHQICSVCERIVTGLLVPCLQCGHATCYDCAQEWFVSSHDAAEVNDSTKQQSTPDLEFEREPTCPTGCGCPCSTLVSANIPLPSLSPISVEGSHSNYQHHQRGESSRLHTPTTLSRTDSHSSDAEVSHHHAHRLTSEQPPPDRAISALLSLNMNIGRSRSISSTANNTVTSAAAPSHGAVGPGTDVGINVVEPTTAAANPGGSITPQDRRSSEYSHSMDELLPWSRDRVTGLGRGVGAGLSRGLSSKGSDSTIRQV